jgi:peroxiredoxin
MLRWPFHIFRLPWGRASFGLSSAAVIGAKVMKSLGERMEETRRSFDPVWDVLYDRFVESLRAAGAASNTPKVGDALVGFALPDSRGRYVSSLDLLALGPLVLSFYRGGWCPYCRTEMTAWAEAAPEVRRLGASFVAVTGETGGEAEALRRKLDLGGEILVDVDHGLALELGLVVHVTDEVRKAYLDFGRDLSRNYGSDAWFIPVPATYVADRQGIIRFAEADIDFRHRAEPEAVLQVLREIGG